MRKGLYQQALTVIEAKTADSFLRHNIMTLTATGTGLLGMPLSDSETVTSHEILGGAMYRYTLKVPAKWDAYKKRDKFNVVFKQYSPVSGNGTAGGTDSLKKKLQEVKEAVLQSVADIVEALKSAQDVSIKNPSTGQNAVYTDAIEYPLVSKPEEERNTPAEADYLENLAVLLFMYKTMKDIRNKVNHAVDNPYRQNAIVNSIYFFIDLAALVCQDTEKWI